MSGKNGTTLLFQNARVEPWLCGGLTVGFAVCLHMYHLISLLNGKGGGRGGMR